MYNLITKSNLFRFAFISSFAISCGQIKSETHLEVMSADMSITSNSPADSSEISIITIASSNPGSVNSHLISTEKGIILIDALRTTSAAKLLSARIDSLKKPLIAIIITHAHPDHFGGLQFLHSRYGSVPIYASSETISDLKTDEGGYIKSTKRFIGRDFGSKVPIPANEIREHDTIAGVSLVVEKMGAGEAANAIIIYLPLLQTLFAGDLINHKMVPYLFEKRSLLIIAQLAKIKEKYRQAYVYPGHGAPGKADELFKEEMEYLSYFYKMIEQRLETDYTITKVEKNEIIQIMIKKYSGYQSVTPMNIKSIYEYNIDAVADEIISSKK